MLCPTTPNAESPLLSSTVASTTLYPQLSTVESLAASRRRFSAESFGRPEAKSVGLYLPESLMFRSDSNGEDLEGYAGAGLYDSVPLHYPEPQRVDYSNDPIMTDQSFRKDLLTRIAHVGLELEQVLGSPQDIEGCVDEEGNVYVVQTRPQM